MHLSVDIVYPLTVRLIDIMIYPYIRVVMTHLCRVRIEISPISSKSINKLNWMNDNHLFILSNPFEYI